MRPLDLRLATVAVALLVTACGQNNTYVAPPPPKVTVAEPKQQPVTCYIEATCNAGAVNSANLVARAQGVSDRDQIRRWHRREAGPAPGTSVTC